MKNILFIATAFIVLLACSCKKPPLPADATLSVRLTDDPALYDAVNIDLQSVIITSDQGLSVTLGTSKGLYNLLNFSNGTDTLIASGTFQSGTMSQIRLVLGTNNSVKVNNVLYPLAAPSAQQSGLKLQVHTTFEEGVAYSLLLDFDAAQSVIEEGNGNYSLKPVIRLVETATSGSIKGQIIPQGISCIVTATKSGSTYSTICNAEGHFLLAGIPSGTYKVTLTPPLPYLAATLNNISVVTGQSTDIGLINF